MRFGLRLQILLSLILLMVTTIALVSLAMLGLTQNNMEAQALRNAEKVARIAATTMAAAIDDELPLTDPYNRANLDRLSELFAQQFEATRITVVGVVGPDSELGVLAAHPRGTDAEIDAVELPVVLASRDLHAALGTTDDEIRQVEVFAPIGAPGEALAVLRLELPLGEVQRLIGSSQQLIMLYIGLDALLIVVVGFFLLTRLIVRPIGVISAATERVADGDLSRGVAVRASNEIGTLAQNFDVMVARLREQRDALESRLSELAEANRALEDAQREVLRSEKMATIGALATGIAHEVGNPLAAVIGLAELLGERESLSGEEIDDIVARIEREMSRISGIIASLLDYARVSASEAEVVDVHTPLVAAVALCSHHPRGRYLGVDVPEWEAATPVVASENRLVQVFLNLLLNAADATEGTGRVEVTVEAVADGGEDWVRVEVSDDGPGIPEPLLSSIFTPFVTTKSAGEGTGLGLAICERIVEGYGGRLTVSSTPGDGATFTVWLRAG